MTCSRGGRVARAKARRGDPARGREEAAPAPSGREAGLSPFSFPAGGGAPGFGPQFPHLYCGSDGFCAPSRTPQPWFQDSDRRPEFSSVRLPLSCSGVQRLGRERRRESGSSREGSTANQRGGLRLLTPPLRALQSGWPSLLALLGSVGLEQ